MKRASLAGIAELRLDRAVNRSVNIRVIEDDEGRIAAELEADLLDLVRALAHEQSANRGGACKADLSDLGIGAEFAAPRDHLRSHRPG